MNYSYISVAVGLFTFSLFLFGIGFVVGRRNGHICLAQKMHELEGVVKEISKIPKVWGCRYGWNSITGKYYLRIMYWDKLSTGPGLSRAIEWAKDVLSFPIEVETQVSIKPGKRLID